MELGEPQRIILVEPLEMPEPLRTEAPPIPTKQPEQVPADVPA